MKKMVKALLFTMLLFVSTNVKALDDMLVHSSALSDKSVEIQTITIKKANGNYAFCLDRNYQYSDTHTNYRDFRKAGYDITDISETKVKNVLLKAYSDGLGTGSNVYGISEEELYIVTQMAVWHASHGVGHNGFDTKFDLWLGNGTRRQAFTALINAENGSDYMKEIVLDNSNYSMTITDDGKYYVSDDITFNGPKNAKYTVSASQGACVLYNGKCEEELEVENGGSFKLRADNNGSKEITVFATIKSTRTFAGYNFSMFVPVDYYGTAFIKSNGEPNQGVEFYNPDGDLINTNNEELSRVQRMGYLIPSYSEVSASVSAKAVVKEDVPTKNDVKEVEIQICTSNDCNIESTVTVFELKSNKELINIDSWTAKSDEIHKINLKVDTYYRLDVSSENEAVATYIKVTEVGEVKLCNIKNKDLSTTECENIVSDTFKIEGSKIIISDCTEKVIEGPGIVEEKTEEVPSDNTTSENTETMTINVPSTGVTTKAYMIGALVMLAGAVTVMIAKKRENM